MLFLIWMTKSLSPHQRDRLALVQESGRRGEMGRSVRDRPLANPQRRACRGRLFAVERSGRNEGYSSLLRKADPQDQSADHDRHHRPAGYRAGADLLPGKIHHQFDQSGGWGRKIRASLPPGQVLWRGGDLRNDR